MLKLSIEARPFAWPHDGRLKPEETALVIVDMQRDFCDPGGYIASMGYDLSDIRAVIPRIAAVRKAVTDWGGWVLYTREGHRQDLSDLSALKAFRSRRAGVEVGSDGPLGRVLVRDEGGWQIIPELGPGPNDIVVDKPGYSAFYATDFEQILRVLGVRLLVLTGVTTDVCVHSTLRSAVDRGFECLLLEDACAATVRENHLAAIDTIATEGGIFGAVANSQVLCAVLASTKRDAIATAPQKESKR